MKINKIFKFFLFVLFIHSALYAQLATNTTGGPDTFGHRWITSRATGPTIDYDWVNALSGTNTGISSPLPSYGGPYNIGFTFNYYDADYTQFYVSEEGFISFNALTDNHSNESETMPNPANPDNILAIAWDDLTRSGSITSGIYYTNVGSAPYRKLIVEWFDYTDSGGGTNQNFQIVLYETSNLIVYQYEEVDNFRFASIGIEDATGGDGLLFASNDNPAVEDNFAILFFGDQVTDANAYISPDTVLTNSGSQTFTYTITDLTSDTDSLGKADSLVINNLFSLETMTVSSIEVDGTNYFIQNSSLKPTDPGYAVWEYNAFDDNLVIQTDHFAIRDSIKITYIQNVPSSATLGSYSFSSSINAVIDPSIAVSTIDSGYTINVVPGKIAYYTVTPEILQTTAGTQIADTVKAYDVNNNLVSTDNSTIVEILNVGGTGVTFNINSGPLNNGQIVFFSTDTVAENYAVRARSQSNTTISGLSNQIIVNPNTADSLFKVNGDGSVVAGTDQLLSVRVTDIYENVISGESVRFIIRSGGGTIGVTTDSVTVVSDINGIADTTLTTGTEFGDNDITALIVSSRADSVNFTVTTTPGGISYFTVIPTTTTTTVGTDVTVNVTAYDANNNIVTTDNSTLVDFSSSGSRVRLSVLSATLNSGLTSFTFADSAAEVLTLTAASNSDPSKTGTSSPVTVSEGAADSLFYISGNGSVVAGTDQLLSVRVTDIYENVISGESVRFIIRSGGGTIGVTTDSVTVLSDINGIADTTLTTGAEFGDNDITALIVSSRADSVNFTVTTTPGGISYFTVIPTTTTTTVGTDVTVNVTAYDANNNIVTTDNSTLVDFSSSGSRVRLSVLSATLNSGLTSFTFADSAAEVLTLTATSNSDPSKTGTSSPVTVSEGAADSLFYISGNGSVVAGTDQLLSVRVTDIYENVISGESVRFIIRSGGGTIGVTTDSVTVVSDINGIADTTLTTGAEFGDNDITALIVSSRADSVNFTVTTTPGGISYFTVMPTTTTTTVGTDVTVNVTAYDANNNIVTTDNSTLVDFSSSGSRVRLSVLSATLNSGLTSFTFADSAAEVLTLTAASNSDPSKTGTSSPVTVSEGAADSLFYISGNGSVVAGTDQLLSVRVTDIYENVISGESVRFIIRSGGGSIGVTTDSVTVLSDINGIADTTLTTGAVFGDNDITALIVSSRVDSVNFTVTTTLGQLAYINIQRQRGAGLLNLGSISITTDSTLTLYAAGYDINDNYIDEINSTWSITGGIGQFTTTTPEDSIVFDAATQGSGTIRAQAVSNGAIYEFTGLITVGVGNVDLIVIRNAPNNGGEVVTTDTVLVGNSLHFYAAAYDADGNYTADSPLDWHTTGNLQESGFSDTTDVNNIIFNPTQPGSGTIFTTSAWTDDSTDIIIVQAGQLTRLEIRTGSNNTGIVLEDSILTAGDSLVLYAAGYDFQGNFLADQNVEWTTEGVDSIGFFNTDSGISNTFHSRVVHSANIKITLNLLSARSGIIKVNPANPFSIVGVSIDTSTAQANGYISDSLAVKILDQFNNIVPYVSINWETPNNGTLSPASSLTSNILGVARSRWRVHSVNALDSAYAISPIISDTVIFFANVISADADSLIKIAGDNQIDTVANTLTTLITVRVVDDQNNNVPNVSLAFSIDSLPAGATGFALGNPSDLTDENGIARTSVTLGNKAGTYRIAAYNQALKESPMYFRAAAVNDRAQNIAVIFGDTQSDTVAQELPLPVRVKVTDQYDNPVANETVDWITTSTASVNITPTTTDILGITSTNWTIRTSTGTDSLIATLTGLESDTIYATAKHDIADSIAVFEGDGTTTIAGSGRLIKTIIYDQYNNIAENGTVNFLPVNRVSSQTDMSDQNGIAQTIYTTPSTLDSSFARAYISGLTDTAVYKIFAIRYIANSLQPKAVTTDTTLDFYVSFSNPGVDTVYLSQGMNITSFSFTDGIRTTNAILDSPMILLPKTDITTLRFGNATINGNFTSGNYTPETNFIGTSGGKDISGVLNTNPGELSIEPLDILSVNIIGATTLSRGDTIQNVEMRVRNNSSYIIENITESLTFSQAGIGMIRFPANPDTIAANSNVVIFNFQVAIPAGAIEENVIIDGYISGNLRANNNLVYDNNARTTDIFEIISGANVSYVEFSPDTLSTGQQGVQFEVIINNSGAANVLLYGSQSTLTFGSPGQAFSLGNDQAITAGTSSVLTFQSTDITLPVGRYQGTLNLIGVENGGNFADTFDTGTDSLLVQSPAVLSMQSIVLSDIVASQGENGETLLINVQNNNDAAAQINSVNLNYNSQYTITPNQSFPIILGGDSSTILSYGIEINDNATAGQDTFRAVINYSDNNSGTNYILNDPSFYDNWNILSKSNLIITSVIATEAQVSQGQQDLEVTIQVQNSGQVDAIVGTSDSVGVQFMRNLNTVNLNVPLSMPDTIVAGNINTYIFWVDVSDAAAVGIDSIRGYVDGRNIRTNAITSHTSNYGDAWLVQTPPQIVINSLINNSINVNSGQQNLIVSVEITNTGQATALIDTVGIYADIGGVITDTIVVATLPVSLASGSVSTVEFNVDISGTFSGDLELDGFVNYYDTNNGAIFYTDSGAVATHHWIVGGEALLVADSVFSETETMSLGQSDAIVRARITNNGDAAVKIDSLRLTYNGSSNHLVLSSFLITPDSANLPTLVNNETFIAEFSMGAASAPLITGNVTLNIDVFGTDLVSVLPVQSAPSVNPDNIILQTPAIISIDSVIANAIQVTPNMDTTVTIVIENTGQADMMVTSLNITNDRGYIYNIIGNPVPSLPQLISGNSSASFTTWIRIPAQDDSGTVTLDAEAGGYDTNTNLLVSDSGATSPGNWLALSKPKIRVVSMSGPIMVVRGQNDILVEIIIENGGGTPVTLYSDEIVPTIGLYDQRNSIPDPILLAGYGQIVVTDTIDIRSNSATGTDNLSTRINFTNNISGISSSTTSGLHIWAIESNSDISIVSVSTNPNFVSQGQTNINIGVRVENNGEANFQIDSLQLIFPDSFEVQNYIVSSPVPSLPNTIAAGSDAVFNFIIDVIDTAQTGLDTLSARLFGQEISSGNQISTIAESFDFWTVQQRPIVSIDSIFLSDTILSTGQQDVIGTIILSNAAGATRAGARIDTIGINFITAGGDTNFSIRRLEPPIIPLILPAGQQAAFNFEIDVNINANAGDYVINGYTEFSDVNDDLTTRIDIPTPQETFTIQTASGVNITNFVIANDTVSQGQINMASVIYQNTGSAPIRIDSVRLNYSIAQNEFTTILLNHTPTPYFVNGNDTDTLNYSISIPFSIANQNVDITSKITGVDINTGFVSSDSSQQSFFVQTPASPVWAGSIIPESTELDTTVQFIVNIINTGQADIQLDSLSTTLELLGTPYSIQLSGASDQTIYGNGDTTFLVFQPRFLTGINPDDYPVILNLNGSSNGSLYSSTLSTGQVTIGGQIYFRPFSIIPPGMVIQGDTGIVAIMGIGNNGSPQPIDISGTTLIFEQSGVPLAPQPVLTRVDTLTILQQTADNQIIFRFDVPLSYLGDVDIFGQISLNGGSLVKRSVQPLKVLSVLSGVAINSLASPANELQVVPRQEVEFNINLENTGTSNLTLVRNETFLDINYPIPRQTFLSGNFVISASDTTTISFEPVEIPLSSAGFSYTRTLYIMGIQANGDTLRDTIAVDDLQVLNPATIEMVAIDNLPNQVRQGQTGITFNYRLANIGQSAGSVQNLLSNFLKREILVNDDWVLAALLPQLPYSISAGDTIDFSAEYNLYPSADTGYVVPKPTIYYNDLRTNSYVDTFMTISSFDCVEVVSPGQIRIDNLYIVSDSIPNAPNVNVNQQFYLKADINNLGNDTVENISLNLLNASNDTIGNYNISQITPGSIDTLMFPRTLNAAGNSTFKIIIASAYNSIDGSDANLLQPIDNTEIIHADVPTILTYQSIINGPVGAQDSSVSTGQQVQLRTIINRWTGTSPFDSGSVKLNLTSNYDFVSPEDSVQIFTSNDSIVDWNIIVTDTSVSIFDTLTIVIQDSSTDINTAGTIPVNVSGNSILLRSENIASFASVPTIITPEGAVDGLLSTGQVFKVNAFIEFFTNVADTGRYAEIILPSNFQSTSPSRKQIPNNVDTANVSWNVTVPDTLITNPYSENIQIAVTAKDANSNNIVTDVSSDLVVEIYNKSDISLVANISAPNGAADLTLSSGQVFDLDYSIRQNTLSQAGFDTTGIIRLQASQGFIFPANNTGTLIINNFRSGTDTTYSDSVKVDNSTTLTSGKIVARMDQLPKDENSGKPVVVRHDSVVFNFQVVPHAELYVDFIELKALPGSNVRLTQQTFNIRAIVRNRGTASVDSGYLNLDLSGINLTLNSPRRQEFFVDDTVFWNVTSLNTPSSGIVRVFADTTKTGGPVDENDGLYAFRTIADAVDSVMFSIEDVGDISQTISFPFPTTANDSITVSTQQDSIPIRSVVNFNQLLDLDRKIKIVLPNKGYATLDSLIHNLDPLAGVNYTLNWYLRAPANSVAWDTIKVIASARSTSNPLVTKTNTTYLFIKTVTRAALVLSSSITDPPGARDGTVSFNQNFTFQAKIVRNGQAGLANASEAEIEINTGSDLSLINPVNSIQVVNSADTMTVNWIIKAAPSISTMQKSNVGRLFKQKFKESHIEQQYGISAEEGIAIKMSREKSLVKELINVVENYRLLSNNYSIGLRINRTPLDENTNKPAYSLVDTISFPITIQDSASVSIVKRASNDTVISGGQNFNYSVKLKYSESIQIDSIGLFINNTGFSYLPITQNLNIDSVATWAISTSDSFTNPVTSQFSVIAWGHDQNLPASSNIRISQPFTDQISVIPKASIKLLAGIYSPIYADSTRIVSLGQTLVLKAWVEKANNIVADVIGTGQINLTNPVQYGFTINPDSLIKTYTGLNDTLYWELQAPDTQTVTAAGLELILDQNNILVDINSGEPARIAQGFASKTISLSVEKKRLVVNNLNDIYIQERNFKRGSENVPLLIFKVSNIGFGADAFIWGMTLGFLSANTEDYLSHSTLENMFDYLEIVDFAEYRQRLETTSVLKKPTEVFLNYVIDGTVQNPDSLVFDITNENQLAAGKVDSFIVLAKINNNAANRSFRIKLVDLYSYDVNRNIPLDIVDTNGDFLDESNNFVSRIFTSVSGDAETNFSNFPNPFGRTEEFTRITFSLESESDVEIRIFTLIGGLVKTWKYPNQARGGYFDLSPVKWYGKNDRGKRVLNGVYICQIQINPRSGGSKQTYITKIAYIK